MDIFMVICYYTVISSHMVLYYGAITCDIKVKISHLGLRSW